jgi:hypothetical protein
MNELTGQHHCFSDIEISYKSYFIAIGEFGTFITISPHFSGQFHLVYSGKVDFFEKSRLIGQAENVGNTKLLSLSQTSLYQLSTYASIVAILIYC